MIYEELLRECAVALDDMKITPKQGQKFGGKNGEATIRFYNERGHELCVYVDIDSNNASLLDTLACHYDCEEITTLAGDVFRFTRNRTSTQIKSYVQLCNILWAHRHLLKSTLPEGTREFHDEDLLSLVLEVQHKKIPHDLEIVNGRPRISFTHEGKEIASVRKSAGRLRYQNTSDNVISSKGIDGEPLKEFIRLVVDDILPTISEIKKNS